MERISQMTFIPPVNISDAVALVPLELDSSCPDQTCHIWSLCTLIRKLSFIYYPFISYPPYSADVSSSNANAIITFTNCNSQCSDPI